MSIEIEGGVNAVVTREFAASPERLYRAFTDPEDAAAWWWGAGAPNTSAEMDVRVGGRFRVGKDAPEDDAGWGTDRWHISGVFVELDPPRRLVYTLHWEGPVGYNQTGDEVFDEAAVVTFDEIDGGGTRVVFRHIGIPDDGMSAAEHGKAINATMDDLAALVGG